MAASVSSDPWMISVDDHLIEPPNVWVDRLPARLRERGPRWVADDLGEAWLVDDSIRVPINGAVVGGAWWRMGTRPAPFDVFRWDEVPKACWDPGARGAAMDQDRVLASLPFPNLPGFAGRLFQGLADKELALACIRAHNDWVIDDFAAGLPARVIPLGIIPMWDGRLAADGAGRILDKGARAVSFSMSPENIGLPSISDDHWDPLFTVMNDAELPLCTHLGSGRPRLEHLADSPKEGVGSEPAGPGAPGPAATDKRPGRSVLPQIIDAQICLVDWLDSGNFERYPKLRLALSENGIGWIPAVLQLVDWSMMMMRASLTRISDRENDPITDAAAQEEARQALAARAREAAALPMPSEVFREHVYGCFITDPLGLRLLDVLGEDNVMVETDDPHVSSVWPTSLARTEEALEGVGPEVRHKILRGNAERAFKFTPMEPPVGAATP